MTAIATIRVWIIIGVVPIGIIWIAGRLFHLSFIGLVSFLQILIHSSNFRVREISNIIPVLGQLIDEGFLHFIDIDFPVFYNFPFFAFWFFQFLLFTILFRYLFVILIDLFYILESQWPQLLSIYVWGDLPKFINHFIYLSIGLWQNFRSRIYTLFFILIDFLRHWDQLPQIIFWHLIYFVFLSWTQLQ